MDSHETMRWVACEVLKEARVDINALSVFVREHVQNPEKYIDLISPPPDKDFDFTTAAKSLLTSIGSKTKPSDVSPVCSPTDKRHASDGISSDLLVKRQSVNGNHVRLPSLKSIIDFPPSLPPSPELSRGRSIQETAVSPGGLPWVQPGWRHEHQSPKQHQPPHHHQTNNHHVPISPGLPADHHQRSHFRSPSQTNSHTYHPSMTPQYNGNQTAAPPANTHAPDLAAVAAAATAVATSGKFYQMPTPMLSPTLQPSTDYSRVPGGPATHLPSGVVASQLSPVIEQPALHQGRLPPANPPPANPPAKLLPGPPSAAMEQSPFTLTATGTTANLSAGRRCSPTSRRPTKTAPSPPPKPITPTPIPIRAPAQTSAPPSTQRCTASTQTHRRRRGRPRKNPEPLSPQPTLPRPHRDIMPKLVPDQVLSAAAREAAMMSMGIRAGSMFSGRHVLGVRRQDATIVPPRGQRAARTLSRAVGTRAGTARVASNKATK